AGCVVLRDTLFGVSWPEAAPEPEQIKCLRDVVAQSGLALGTRCPWHLGPRNGCYSFSHVLFPGCELTARTKSYTFQVDEEDDSDHILALSVVCLTDGAKDECNVVEVVGRNHENQEIAVPVANLKLSCQPLLSLDNFKLQPPVTFRLAAGSGPVHLAGWHQISKDSCVGKGSGGARGTEGLPPSTSTDWGGSPWEVALLNTSAWCLLCAGSPGATSMQG
uniref:Nucleophosmin/nucleoplasmin 3 n=1 Tax=Calidris pygmaea TaxID=425635 RepID=A0A8C3PK34_9CHAR